MHQVKHSLIFKNVSSETDNRIKSFTDYMYVTSLSINSTNTQITVTFLSDDSRALSTSSDEESIEDLTKSNFDISLSGGAVTTSDVTIDSITKISNTEYVLNITVDNYPNGDELVTVSLKQNDSGQDVYLYLGTSIDMIVNFNGYGYVDGVLLNELEIVDSSVSNSISSNVAAEQSDTVVKDHFADALDGYDDTTLDGFDSRKKRQILLKHTKELFAAATDKDTVEMSVANLQKFVKAESSEQQTTWESVLQGKSTVTAIKPSNSILTLDLINGVFYIPFNENDPFQEIQDLTYSQIYLKLGKVGDTFYLEENVSSTWTSVNLGSNNASGKLFTYNHVETNSNIYFLWGSSSMGGESGSSGICILEGSLIKTDQGIKLIEDLTINNTINKLPILDIYRSPATQPFVCIKKHSLGYNIPNRDTYLSNKHLLYDRQNNLLTNSENFIDETKIIQANLNKKKYCYHILLPNWSLVTVNNLECESLCCVNNIAINFYRNNNIYRESFVEILKKQANITVSTNDIYVKGNKILFKRNNV